MEKDKIKELLEKSKNIAIVGCSRSSEKDSYVIAEYLQKNGYKIIPINPNGGTILNEKVYTSLKELKKEIRNVDIIDIFRPSEECIEIVKDSLNLKPKLIWMQVGIQNKEAEKIAKENGIDVIMNQCIMIQHMALIKRSK